MKWQNCGVFESLQESAASPVTTVVQVHVLAQVKPKSNTATENQELQWFVIFKCSLDLSLLNVSCSLYMLLCPVGSVHLIFFFFFFLL